VNFNKILLLFNKTALTFKSRNAMIYDNQANGACGKKSNPRQPTAANMEGSAMEQNKKNILPVYAIVGVLAVSILFTSLKAWGDTEGWELRSYMQVLKGLWQWLVTPFTIIFAGNSLFKTYLQGKHKHLRIALLIPAILVVTLVDLCLGIGYIFYASTEKIDENGYIVGIHSDGFKGNYEVIYEPVYGIFRKPFEGWSVSELTARLQEKYGTSVEYVKEKNDGFHLFCVPDIYADGEVIYFHCKNDYYMTTDFVHRIIQNQAIYFWSKKDRLAGLPSYENGPQAVFRALDGSENLYKELRTGSYGTVDFTDYIEGEMVYNVLEDDGTLYLSCDGSDRDIAALAGDLTDWYAFLGKCPYLYDENGDFNKSFYTPVAYIISGSPDSSFRINLFSTSDDALPGYQEALAGTDWRTLQRQFAAVLAEKFNMWEEKEKKHIQEASEPSPEPTPFDFDAYAKEYIENYDTDYYELECTPGDGQIKYRFVVLDAALGSRMYGILKSEDSGESWKMWSHMPFGDYMGGGIDAVFLDESFGFATLSYNGGDSADLYVTVDGGLSYTQVILENYTVTLEDGYTYTPYDFPQMPYQENGKLYMLCGQGADGDYDGGDRKLARYQSEDGGYTFFLVDFVEKQQ